MPEQCPINWTNEGAEVSLFVAMVGYKPVGVGKHFQMLFIHDKFCRLVNKEIPTRVLWDRLDEMYDLEALDKSEISPFPNARVRDFELPDDEFGDLIAAKRRPMESGSSDDEEDDDSEEENEPEADTRGKDGGQQSNVAAKPAATGGKTGKGDWTPAKASPVPTALAKANKNKSDVEGALQDAMPSPSPASSTKSSTPAPESGGEKKMPPTPAVGVTKDKDKDVKVSSADADKKDNTQQQQQPRRSAVKELKTKEPKDEAKEVQKKEAPNARRTTDVKVKSVKDDETKAAKRVTDARKEHSEKRSRASSATDDKPDIKESKEAVSRENTTSGNNKADSATPTLQAASKVVPKARRESRRPDSLSGRRDPLRRRSRSRNVSPAPSTGSRRNASPATNPGRRNSSPSTSTKRTGSPAIPVKPAASPAAVVAPSRKRATRSDTNCPATQKRARAR